MACQHLHLGLYGRAPRRGEPRWSCIGGITAEGARSPTASNHIAYRLEPVVLYGGSPLEAGYIALQRAAVARDAKGRHLRCDGGALLAGVASYPIPRQLFHDMPAEGDIYCRWRNETCAWLQAQFGAHLHSIVEHSDEAYQHVHFYVVPALLADGRFNLPEIHPGRRMKADAAEAGASKRAQDAAYRCGMSRWQDTYHYDVSRFFGHDRYGPRRMRVSRMQRKMELKMQAEQVALAAERAAFERTQAAAQAELDRERAQITAAAHQSAWLVHGKAHADLRAACVELKRRAGAERAGRQAAEAEAERLRARVAALEEEAPLRFVA
jgi:hypothetical protein